MTDSGGEVTRPAERAEPQPLHRPALGLVLVAGVAAVFAVLLVGLPRENAPLPAIARQAVEISLPLWKTPQAVSEVVYGTRAFDTFGETFLLLAAAVSVVLLCRGREPRRGYVGETMAGEREQSGESQPAPDRGESEARSAERSESGDERPELPDHERVGTHAPEPAAAMSVIVRYAVRLAVPVLAVAGIYLFAQGYSPGGGFPAGVVIAGVVLLLWAAWGYRRIARFVRPGLVEVLEVVGALALVVIEVLGLVLRGSVSANWVALAQVQTLRSGGVLQLFSIAEFVEVGTGLVVVIFSLIGMRHEWTSDEDDE